MVEIIIEMKKNENLLMSPLWILYNKNEEKLDKGVAEQFKDIHGLKTRKLIYGSLQWAEKNVNYKFVNIFNRMPSEVKVEYTDQEIYKYLMNFKSFMEVEEYGLLTDDRPTSPPWEKQ